MCCSLEIHTDCEFEDDFQPYPMSSLEDALEVIDTLIGLLIFAVIVGSVGSIISTVNKEKSEFQEILDGIKFYMNYRYFL